MRGLLAVLACAVVAGCGQQDGTPSSPEASPIRARIEKEVRTRLRAAVRAEAGAVDTGPVLTDDTPRIEIRDVEKEGIEEDATVVFLRGASVRVPVAGLASVAATASDAGFRLQLGYAGGGVEILDATESPAAFEEVERLKAAGARIGLDDWKAIENAVRAWARTEGYPKSDIAEELASVQAAVAARGERWSHRFGKDLGRLRRAALRTSVADARGNDLGEVYDACRLLVVKREILAALEGPATRKTWPLAAGPTTGVCRGEPGSEFLHAILDGPDGMAFEIRIRGAALDGQQARLLLGSPRPFAENRGRARVFEKLESGPVAVLGRVSSLHLDPEPDRAVALLESLRATQPLAQRVQTAESLARWLSAEAEERPCESSPQRPKSNGQGGAKPPLFRLFLTGRIATMRPVEHQEQQLFTRQISSL